MAAMAQQKIRNHTRFDLGDGGTVTGCFGFEMTGGRTDDGDIGGDAVGGDAVGGDTITAAEREGASEGRSFGISGNAGQVKKFGAGCLSRAMSFYSVPYFSILLS